MKKSVKIGLLIGLLVISVLVIFVVGIYDSERMSFSPKYGGGNAVRKLSKFLIIDKITSSRYIEMPKITVDLPIKTSVITSNMPITYNGEEIVVDVQFQDYSSKVYFRNLQDYNRLVSDSGSFNLDLNKIIYGLKRDSTADIVPVRGSLEGAITNAPLSICGKEVVRTILKMDDETLIGVAFLIEPRGFGPSADCPYFAGFDDCDHQLKCSYAEKREDSPLWTVVYGNCKPLDIIGPDICYCHATRVVTVPRNP